MLRHLSRHSQTRFPLDEGNDPKNRSQQWEDRKKSKVIRNERIGILGRNHSVDELRILS